MRRLWKIIQDKTGITTAFAPSDLDLLINSTERKFQCKICIKHSNRNPICVRIQKKHRNQNELVVDDRKT